ncbi:galactose-1-phosphate uridylyltransferase [Infundibulicybe gibba]|nr:galactose-1-phosphate uridylyltransferase [Infundibulicybe gibba]
MDEFDPSTHPHRRFNPLTNEHVLVSPHRTKRPWLGHTEPLELPDLPQHDPKCYLCPGNIRSGGEQNPDYTHTYIFENDFAAVLPHPIPAAPAAPHPLLTSEPVGGRCDVLVFHRRHDVTLARLPPEDIERVIELWIQVYKLRGSQENIKYIQIFENKGAIMGCSNPHPHGQVWSLSAIPTIPATELTSLENYSTTTTQAVSEAPRGPGGKPCLLCDYIHTERLLPREDGRIIVENEDWVALVPWWAIWPFEVLLLPYKRHISSILCLTESEKKTLADILGKVTVRYDNLFRCSFAYSMGIHQRPVPPRQDGLNPDGDTTDHIAHLHIHFTPPLLRSATVRKFLVGFELMAEAQRDLTPEQAAQRLRDCSEQHYLHAEGSLNE